MLDNFYKYQSVGNDFILFDAYYKDPESLAEIINNKGWKSFVARVCQRHFGIGADGVLIIRKNEKLNLPELLIYNSDGSSAEICINGLRCAALHLHDYHDFDNRFKIKVGQEVSCHINKNNVTIKISGLQYLGTKAITIHEKDFLGHIVTVPNPHFIIPQKTTNDWLLNNGKLIELHKFFKEKTNVEFVWAIDHKNNYFNVLVYERGVGITLSCGSGATGICWSLFKTHKTIINQKVNLIFSGGKIVCWVDKNKRVCTKANAKLIFKGNV